MLLSIQVQSTGAFAATTASEAKKYFNLCLSKKVSDARRFQYCSQATSKNEKRIKQLKSDIGSLNRDLRRTKESKERSRISKAIMRANMDIDDASMMIVLALNQRSLLHKPIRRGMADCKKAAKIGRERRREDLVGLARVCEEFIKAAIAAGN